MKAGTKLRNKLFDYLDKTAEGETVVIQRNNQEVARLVPIGQMNWRDKMKIKPKLLTSPEEFIKPIKEILTRLNKKAMVALRKSNNKIAIITKERKNSPASTLKPE